MKFFKKKPKVADERQVFSYACWLLARRNYSQKELLDKFEVKYIPNEEVFAKVFAKLIKFNLQSDEGFAESFVRSHEHWGARRNSLELKRRGIEEEMIEKFLPNEVSETQNARETLAKKLRGEELPKDWKDKQKLAAFLARRGFDLDVIREVMGF